MDAALHAFDIDIALAPLAVTPHQFHLQVIESIEVGKQAFGVPRALPLGLPAKFRSC